MLLGIWSSAQSDSQRAVSAVRIGRPVRSLGLNRLWQTGLTFQVRPFRWLLVVQALFCQVPVSHVLNLSDVSNIWHVPLMMEAQEAHRSICSHLSLEGAGALSLTTWRTTLAERWDRLEQACHIAMVGKYTGLSDAYLSVIKALQVTMTFIVAVPKFPCLQCEQNRQEGLSRWLC